MSNLTSQEIVKHLIETTGDTNWYVNTKVMGTPVGHRNFPPLAVQRHVTEAYKQLSAKQQKIAAMAGDKNKIDAEDLAKLRSMKKEEADQTNEVAPPGWEKTVKAMKGKKGIDNPWALAWSMKKKGYKSHMKENNDSHTHAAHFSNSKGEWSGMALIDAKDDNDAIDQAHKISAGNKWKDFKLSGVERHVPVKEEVESIDEISTKLATKYVAKAAAGSKNRTAGQILAYSKAKGDAKIPTTEEVDQIAEISNKLASIYANKAWSSGDDKRAKGLNLAIKKMAGKGAKVSTTMEDNKKPNYNTFAGVTYRPPNTSKDRRDPKDHKHEYDLARRVDNPLRKKVEEEVEQVNELKKSTLASYIKKAAIQRTHAASQAGVEFGIGVGSDAYKSDSKYIAKQNQKVGKRTLGMDKALNKLAKEEVEKNLISTESELELVLNEAIDPSSIWRKVFTHGSKAAQKRLTAAHGHKPEFKSMMKSIGVDGGEKSVKQASVKAKPKSAAAQSATTPADKKPENVSSHHAIRALNAARQASYYAAGKHRSVGSAGTTANLSPIEKKVGDVNKLEKKKTTTALGASPSERESAKADKIADAKKASEPKERKLTGKVGISERYLNKFKK